MIKWEKAVSGKVGVELARQLRGAGIVDQETLLKNPDVFQKIELAVFRPLAYDLIAKGAGKQAESGEVAWSKVRGYSGEFEDLLYSRGIYTIEQANGKVNLLARLISRHKKADRASLSAFALSEQHLKSEPIEEAPVMEEKDE